MIKSDLELFKQALSEGLSESFDSVVNSYTGEVVCSKRHGLVMRTIVYGKTSERRILSPKAQQIIAILIAAALALTSCAVIFRNELREIFEEFYVKISISDSDKGNKLIEEVYELTYVPEGFHLETANLDPIGIDYVFYDESGKMIRFEQGISDGSSFIIDSENGYSKMLNMQGYDIYFRDTTQFKSYIWTDGKYSFMIKTNAEITDSEILAIIQGLKVK